MKRVIKMYTEHKNSIQFYIRSVLHNFQPSSKDMDALSHFFESEKSAEFIYSVDQDFTQQTPTIGRREVYKERNGTDKSFYFKWISFKEESIHISNPYLHHITGQPMLTAVKQIGDDYLVIDFDILTLLSELRLIEHNTLFNKVNTVIMAGGALLLGIVSVFLILYGGYIFIAMLFSHFKGDDVMHEIFTSIISITIGLAIYDLAKTILENDVLFKTLNFESDLQNKTLIKFLTSIIVALSIESLMAVFKIVLDDYNKLINAFYLVIAVTFFIIGTAIFNKLSFHKN
ncbi:hypothetical protein [Sulfurimonas marina]|uniref:General glycosylation pathway protein n=1 Tax=Sulfurimonas marina TaxID=2590551 RepID=A0A7M1AUK4_9BACT|nr:hypothetical protein [Sulfurimonas marina]QOP41107.1 hypothetical protein FJR03_04860 [Sulfurimonas marina]